MNDSKRRQNGRKGLNFYWKLILYSHSVWVTNTICSLFRYFSIILFAAYTAYSVYRHIYVRFSLEIFVILQHCLIENFSAEIVFVNSPGVLIQFLDKFLYVSLLFKNVPTQNSMFYTWSQSH